MRTNSIHGLIVAIGAAVLTATGAIAQDDEDSRRSRNLAISPDVGEPMQAAMEKIDADDLSGALADFERILAEERTTDYELGVLLQFTGQLRQQLDDYPGAITDWRRAVDEGDLPQEVDLGLVRNIGTLYLIDGDYRVAVDTLQEWIAMGGVPSDRDHLNLVRAYAELGEDADALRHGRLAFEVADPPARIHYDTLNTLYTDQNMTAERLALLEEMAQVFPQDPGVWRQVAFLYAQTGRERDAFEINRIMYVNGMVTTERQIMQVVDYHSFYDVPYRGARILEAEINAGRVTRSRDNLEKLARLYRQANEFDRAIGPLETAARLSSGGELYRTLGEAYYAEGRVEEAETALVNALDQGGFGENTGDVWVLLGNARYEQEKLRSAIDAFAEAERYQKARATARDWRVFVEGEVAAARNDARFRIDVVKEEHRVSCLRQDDIIVGVSDVCTAILERGDYSLVPEIVAMEADFAARFGVVETGAGETATPEDDLAPMD